MVRVLQIVDHMGVGGIQVFIMNVYRTIDREQVQFDFLLHRRQDSEYEKEIEEYGGRIYCIPSRRNGIIKNKHALKKFFSEHHEYTVVHQHISSLTYIEPLLAAKKAGVKTRIVHSHSTRITPNIVHSILHKINAKKIKDIATDYYACSDKAAEWFYSTNNLMDKAVILQNGINCSEYEFNKDVRDSYRKKFGWEGKNIIGHVGRFHYPKNHEFLIEIFRAFHEKAPNSILVLAGDGNLRLEIEKKVNDYGLTEDVVFLGNRNDVNKLLQAFDLFMLPSRYEGFPVSIVEAQAAGLHCVVSDNITRSVNLTGNVKFCSLEAPLSEWVALMEEEVCKARNQEDMELVRKAGFDSKEIAMKLYKKYVNS